MVSLLAHASVVVGPLVNFTCVPDLEMPEIEFETVEIELVDPNSIQSELATEEPEPQPEPPAEEPEPPPPPPEPDPGPEPQPEPPPEPDPVVEPEQKKFAEKRSGVDKLAPPKSTFHMMLVPKKIRKLSFKQQVLDIMAPLPDFELLVDQGRFDALRDFDHIVIASPDIRDWTQTFLAVDYRLPRDEVKLAIERAVATRGEVIEWVEDDGPLRGNPRPADPEAVDPDNRWFVFLDRKVAIYVRDEFLPNILEGPTEDGRKTAGNFVANLARMRRFSARQPRAGMQLKFSGLTRGIKGTPKIGGKPLPFSIPDGFELSASAEEEPEVLLRFEFENVVEAKAFATWWDVDLRALIDDNFTIKLQAGWMYDLFEVERDGAQVRLTGVMTTAQAQKVMQFAADGSRRVAGKTPEEIEQMRQRRVEAIEARRGGKLPPSALDPEEEEDQPEPEGGDPSTPTAPAPGSDPAPGTPDPRDPAPSPAVPGPPKPAPSPAPSPSGPSGSAPKPTKPTTNDADGEPDPG